MQSQLKNFEAELKKKVDRERERAAAEVDAKLQLEREKELRKYKLEMSKLADKKDDISKSQQVKVNQEKKRLERAL